MAEDTKRDPKQQVTMTLTLEEWGSVKSAVFAMWEKAVKLDEKARKADFSIKEQTAKSAEELGQLMDKIDRVVS